MALTTVKSDQIQTSVALAGSPTTTTQSASDNSTKVATTAYVETAVANLVASAPAALNTLDELAAALNDDASFSTTITNSIATKLPLAGGTLTGNLGVGGAETNPKSFAKALGVHGSTNSGLYLHDDNAGRYGYLEYDGNNFNISAQHSAGTLNLKTNDTTRVTIDSSGNTTFAGNIQVGSTTVFNNSGVLQSAALSGTYSNPLNFSHSSLELSGHMFFNEYSTGRHYIHFKTAASTNQIDWRIQTNSANNTIHSWTNTLASFATAMSVSGNLTATGTVTATLGASIASQTNMQLALRDSDNTNMRANFMVEKAANNNRGGLAIQATESGVSNDRDLYLQPNGGRVGILTAAPQYPFHVVGNSYFTGTIASQNIAVTASSTTAVGLSIKRSASNGRAQMTLLDESGSQMWRFGSTGGGSTSFAFFDGSANVLSINASDDSVDVAGAVTAGGVLTANGVSSDGEAKNYVWRAVDNSGSVASPGYRYVKICRITGGQSQRVNIELSGRYASYGNGSLAAYGMLVGQCNNDNNYDFVFYDYQNGQTGGYVVSEVGQVNVSSVTVDIYIKIEGFSEIIARAMVSDHTLTPETGNSGTSQGSSSAPSGYSAITAQRVLITDTSGHVTIPDGNLKVASGHGIDFSNAPNSNAGASHSTLDDYEEGSFSPTLFGGGTQMSTTGGAVIGRYTKIGNLVSIWGVVQRFDANSVSGNINVQNLPFTLASVSGFTRLGMGWMWVDNGTNLDRLGQIYMTTTPALLGVVDFSVRTGRYLQMTSMTNGRPLYFCATYQTDQ